jgi:7-cyano-7-deazaguanine reductase
VDDEQKPDLKKVDDLPDEMVAEPEPFEPNPGLLEHFEAPKSKIQAGISVHLEQKNFTWLSPESAEPKFGVMFIDYLPAEKVIENDSFLRYTWDFRIFEEYAEPMIERICNDLVMEIKPRMCKVTLQYSTNDGVPSVTAAEYWSPEERRARQGPGIVLPGGRR